jgi:hypothetical protein
MVKLKLFTGCFLRRCRKLGSVHGEERRLVVFISWIQSGPDGGRSADEGRQGSINADARIARALSGHRLLPSSRSASGLARGSAGLRSSVS